MEAQYRSCAGCVVGESTRTRKSKAEKKQASNPKRPDQLQTQQELKDAEELKSDKGLAIQECDQDEVIRRLEENEVYRKFIECVSEGSDIEVEQKMQEYLAAAHEFSGWDQGQVEIVECGIRWAVEAKRKGQVTERE